VDGRHADGGRHLHFDYTRRLALITLPPDLEIKTLSREGCPLYIPMPPTWRAPNGVYRLLDDRPPAISPDAWTAEMARRIEERDARQPPQRDTDQPPIDFERREAERVLSNLCERIAATRTSRRTSINSGALVVSGCLCARDEEDATRRQIEAGGTRSGPAMSRRPCATRYAMAPAGRLHSTAAPSRSAGRRPGRLSTTRCRCTLLQPVETMAKSGHGSRYRQHRHLSAGPRRTGSATRSRPTPTLGWPSSAWSPSRSASAAEKF